MSRETLKPTHPGKILQRGLKDMNLTLSRTARETGIPLSTLSAIVNGRRPVSAENALRLGRYLKTTPRYWVNLQSDYDLRMATASKGERIEREVLPAVGE